MLALNAALVLGCPLVFIAVHGGLSRVWGGRSPQRTAVASILVAGALCVAILWPLVWRDAILWVYALTVVFSMGYVYFHIFNMGETARRIRIMIELRNRGAVTENDLIDMFTREDPIQVRLDRLVELGQLRKEGDAYCLDGRLLWCVAMVVAGWRWLLGYADAHQN